MVSAVFCLRRSWHTFPHRDTVALSASVARGVPFRHGNSVARPVQFSASNDSDTLTTPETLLIRFSSCLRRSWRTHSSGNTEFSVQFSASVARGIDLPWKHCIPSSVFCLRAPWHVILWIAAGWCSALLVRRYCAASAPLLSHRCAATAPLVRR